MTAGLYSFNINESYFGLPAARREADLGEMFWLMLEPKLPGSLEAKLELIDYKKAFQAGGSPEKRQWEQNVLFHNMGIRLFDEDVYRPFYLALQKNDQKKVLRDIGDPDIRQHLEKPFFSSFSTRFETPERSLETVYRTLFFDSGMTHGYYNEPHQYSPRTIEAMLRSGEISSEPLKLVFGLEDGVSNQVQPPTGNGVTGLQALITARYLAAMHHGYVQSRYTFLNQFDAIQNLNNSYALSEKHAIASVSWETETSPLDNIIHYQHIKDNGHLYQSRGQRPTPDGLIEGNNEYDMVFEYVGTFKEDEGPRYDRFICKVGQSENGDVFTRWYTETDGIRTEFTAPSGSNVMINNENEIEFSRVEKTRDRDGRGMYISLLCLAARQLVGYLDSQADHPLSLVLSRIDEEGEIRDSLERIANALLDSGDIDLEELVAAINTLYSKVEGLIPGNGEFVGNINADTVKAWGFLYPIMALGRVCVNSLNVVDDVNQIPDNENIDRGAVLEQLELAGVLVSIQGEYRILRPLESDDLPGDMANHFDEINQALLHQSNEDVFPDQKAILERNGAYVVGSANVQSVYSDGEQLRRIREQQVIIVELI